MINSVVRPWRGSKALPKAKLARKKGHGHCLAVCCPSDPLQLLNPGETITSEKYAPQIDKTYWKLQCLQPKLVNRKARPHISQPMLQKLNELGYKVLPHPPYSPDLLTTDYHFFKHLNNFLQGKHFHNQQDAENAYKNLSDAQFFYARTINKLISHY